MKKFDAKKVEFPELTRLHEQIENHHRLKTLRLQALHKIKSKNRGNESLYHSLVEQGKLLTIEDKKRRNVEIAKVIGDDRFGRNLKKFDIESQSIFARSDLEHIPSRNIAGVFGRAIPTCKCGEAELYVQPAWTGTINGPFLDYYLWGDGKDHVYDWDDAPPDFEWLVKPEEGQVKTASARMHMAVEGGDDGWNQSWAWLDVLASWQPTSPGRFSAHVHFGDSSGPTNAGIVGDGCEPWPWDDEAYFGAWIYLSLFYEDPAPILLGNTGWRTIADQYECGGWDAMGLCPWYWKLDHWLSLGEFSIPVNKRVVMMMGIKFETSAGSDDECCSGVFFDETRPLLIQPIITGIQCGRL